MNSYSNETYGERMAGIYDEWFPDYDSHAIDTLAELAQGGKALELGVGTGRIALPLAAKGVEVHGIDAAESMLAQLRAKPGGEHVTVTQGNFADITVDGKFSLVYIVFNTLFALTTQDEQVQCFRSVAAHLAPGGCFVVEAFVPDPRRFTGGQVNWATRVTNDLVELDVGHHDAASQRVVSQKVVFNEGNVHLYPLQIRYVWPSELDLMAQLAGLRLRERWSSWKRDSFTSESTKHISIYE
ncbi:MAG TPA: class I SAM-dependent methyltransferase [Pyrinomonadaceae bacterium]|nr:class I SAM-dependent methyltransferase [Pyrinomonadaceae bacterium]